MVIKCGKIQHYYEIKNEKIMYMIYIHCIIMIHIYIGHRISISKIYYFVENNDDDDELRKI